MKKIDELENMKEEKCYCLSFVQFRLSLGKKGLFHVYFKSEGNNNMAIKGVLKGKRTISAMNYLAPFSLKIYNVSIASHKISIRNNL